METGTLKQLRMLIPGIMISGGCIPSYGFITNQPIRAIQGFNWLLAGGASLLIIYITGAIYNLYQLRSVFNSKSHSKITGNIKQRLLDIGRTQPLEKKRRDELLSGNALMDVFYSLIDSNDTLKERAKLVRLNGLIWTSTADAVVIGVVFTELYLPVWVTTDYTFFLFWGLGAGILAFIAYAFLHPTAVKRQIRLSNDQLDFIAQNLKKSARKKVNKL